MALILPGDEATPAPDTAAPDTAPPPEAPAVPAVHDAMTAARLGGWDWPSIGKYLSDATAGAQDAGYSQDEINSYLGYQPGADLSDQIHFGARAALDAGQQDESTAHPIEDASGGAVPGPGDQPLKTMVTPDVAQSY